MEEAQIWSASTKQNMRERVSVKVASMIEELLLDTVDIIRNEDIPCRAGRRPNSSPPASG